MVWPQIRYCFIYWSNVHTSRFGLYVMIIKLSETSRGWDSYAFWCYSTDNHKQYKPECLSVIFTVNVASRIASLSRPSTPWVGQVAPFWCARPTPVSLQLWMLLSCALRTDLVSKLRIFANPLSLIRLNRSVTSEINSHFDVKDIGPANLIRNKAFYELINAVRIKGFDSLAGVLGRAQTTVRQTGNHSWYQKWPNLSFGCC